MMQDRKSWEIADSAVAGELISIMGVVDSEAKALAALAGEANTAAEAMVNDFYTRLNSHANTAEYLAGASSDRLRAMLTAWWNDIFGGVYDTNYAQKRIAIGRVHVQIGLPVRYPLAMLDIIMQHGTAVAEKGGTTAVAAFRKILALDIAIFNQAYENHQLKHLSELVGNERLARRLLAGG
ncbi:MAG: protoglobin domain-containing protein [Deinococcales bacterium]